MPFIDRDRWKVLEPLLDRALSLSTSDREPWLGELQSRSPEAAADLTSLLAERAAADGQQFLVEPLTDPLARLQLGAYSLERPLGHGGMGTVWLARRTDGRFDGHAAVKVLNLALLSATGQERFHREGSMLAQLAHPGIARLFDAGVSPSGQPYLVLEYVEGEPIDAYANRRRLAPVERVRLVLQVLAAVGHAHANLIVHRDLKPSNILVTADGMAKLLDFGIAKLLTADGGAAPNGITRDGLALTPAFAAPEQLHGGPITTATDVYAVGVLLYLLLTGRHPYDLAERSPAEVERLICDSLPPRPSATFDPQTHEEADRTTRAAARGATPARLRRRLRGDLDTIVMKALRKEPERRYPTAAALQDDLQRFLDGHPVLARPDTVTYRVRKFVGRHRRAVAIGTLAGALLVGGVVRESTLRGRAEAEAHKSNAVKAYLVSVFDVADPFATQELRGPDVTARALLDRGAARIESSFVAQPDVQAELRGVVGRVYGSLGLFDKAEPLLQRALDQQRKLYGPRHEAVAEAMARLGQLRMAQSRFDEAEPLLREALAQQRALLGNVHAETAHSLDHLATLLQDRSRYSEAEPLFREVVAINRAIFGPDHERVGNSLNNLGLLLSWLGRYDETESLYREALAIALKRLGENHPRTAQLLHNLASLLVQRGRFDEAEPLYRRALAAKRKALGDLHPSVTINLNNLGNMLAIEMGRLDEAEPLVTEALALDRRIFGERHAYVAESLRNVASVRRLRGDFGDAERMYREALAMNRALFGEVHIRIASNLKDIGITLAAVDDFDRAIPLFRESLAQYARIEQLKNRGAIIAVVNLARTLREDGQAAEAERLFREAVDRIDPASQANRELMVAAHVGLGLTLTDQDRPTEATPVIERAIAMSRERFGVDHWRTSEAQLAQGLCLAASGQAAAAEPILREAAAKLGSQRRAQPRLAREASAALAHVSQRLQAHARRSGPGKK